jgi:hypothetical protein
MCGLPNEQPFKKAAMLYDVENGAIDAIHAVQVHAA